MSSHKKNLSEITGMVRKALGPDRSILDLLGPDMLVKGMIRSEIRIAVLTMAVGGLRVFYGNTEELVSITNLIMDEHDVLHFQVFDFEPNSRELTPAQR